MRFWRGLSCSPGPTKKIVAVDVRSSTDFDGQHPAGLSLKDLILMRNSGEWYPKLEINAPVSAGPQYPLKFQFYKYPAPVWYTVLPLKFNWKAGYLRV